MPDPNRLRAELDELAEHVHQRLLDRGYTDDEIDRAAQGLVGDNRLQPTDDGETVAGDWWLAEALGELRDARKALQRDDTAAAERHLAEARERVALAQINHDGPDTDLGRGRRAQQRRFAWDTNAARHREAEAQRQRWRDEDDRLHAERPQLRSKNARARIIRSRLDADASEDTIARTLPRR